MGDSILYSGSYFIPTWFLAPTAAFKIGPQNSICVVLPEPVFLNVYGAPELIPRNEFRQPM